jgi:uncharacterized protein
MNPISSLLQRSPDFARFVPFAIIYLLTYLQGSFGVDSNYWVYCGKMILCAWIIWKMRPLVSEMRWAFSWEAVVVGVAIFVIWVGLDPYYPRLDLFMKPSEGDEWTPFERYGQDSLLAWTYIIIRVLGMTFVVPPIEEVFYRSWLYRIFIKNDWEEVPIGYFAGASFVACSLLFGLAHPQWLAGIVCGAAYLGLIVRKKRLGDAMTAHAITNFLLAVWVVWKGDWKFF